MSLDVHVVEYRASGPGGLWADLAPHAGTNEGRWSTCGVVAEIGVLCAAQVATSGERCRKDAIVALRYRAKRSRVGYEARDLGLCGSHLAAHRAGHRLVVLVTSGRMA